MVEEEAEVEPLPLVPTAQQVVGLVDIPITHMKVVEAETLLVVTSIFLVVLVKCHTDLTPEKDLVDLHSGIKLGSNHHNSSDGAANTHGMWGSGGAYGYYSQNGFAHNNSNGGAGCVIVWEYT